LSHGSGARGCSIPESTTEPQPPGRHLISRKAVVDVLWGVAAAFQ
jgi:hypothetical protein